MFTTKKLHFLSIINVPLLRKISYIRNSNCYIAAIFFTIEPKPKMIQNLCIKDNHVRWITHQIFCFVFTLFWIGKVEIADILKHDADEAGQQARLRSWCVLYRCSVALKSIEIYECHRMTKYNCLEMLPT